jgi:succinate-acetate transporter protein
MLIQMTNRFNYTLLAEFPNKVYKMSEKLANPAPLGLLGFGLTTILLNMHNAGFFEFSSMILAMGIAYGGFAQVIAGIMEYHKGNTFGTVAFSSYGLFWLSFVFIFILPGVTAPSAASLGAYLALWGIFTALMFLGTLKANRALQLVFASLAILFFLLAIGISAGVGAIVTIGGYEGIICGFSAFYLAIAEVLNETYGRTVLPIGKVAK